MRPTDFRLTAIAAALSGVLTGLTGCASIGSRKVEQGKVAPGMTYYLPMRYAEVAYTRLEAAPPNAAKLAEANALRVIAKARLAAANAALLAAESKLLEIKKEFAVGSTQVSEAKKTVADARSERDLAQRALVASERTLADQTALKQDWKNSHPQCGFEDRFKLTLQQPVADTSKKYAIDLKHYWTRNDDWDLMTSASGLLSNVDGTITDQSAEILVALAQSAAAVGRPFFGMELSESVQIRKFDFSAIASPAEAEKRRIELVAQPCDFVWKEVELSRVIDPARLEDWTRYLDDVNRLALVDLNRQEWIEKKKVRCSTEGDTTAQLQCVKKIVDPPSISFNYQALAEEPTKFSDSNGLPTIEGYEYRCGSSRSGAMSKCVSGLYFRRELPLSVRIENADREVGRFFLMLPNHSGADFLPLPASAFATTTQKVGFTDGILVSLDSERPSELLTVAAVPWNIAAATIGVLSQIIQFRVDYATNEVTLIKQQTQALEEMQTLMREQDEYEAALERRAAGRRQEATGTNSGEIAEPGDSGQR